MNKPHLFGRHPKPGADNRRGSAEDEFAVLRQAMVDTQIVRRGVKDPRVIAAMNRVPRHEFVSENQRANSYDDHALPIGWSQTISQPYIVALMTEALQLPDNARVLEIGTGSGYQAAVLAEIAANVFTLEIVPELAARAAVRFSSSNVVCAQLDGAAGWPDQAPFDGILVAAAAPQIPPGLPDQLKIGGRLVMPVGGRSSQQLMVITREPDGFREERILPVCFVPMTGRAQTEARD